MTGIIHLKRMKSAEELQRELDAIAPAEPYNPEEERKENKRYLESKMAPELLRHFSKQEALKLTEMFLRCPSTTTCIAGLYAPGVYNLNGLSPKAKTFLNREIADKRVIEIGVGESPQEAFFKSHGAREYIGVEPKNNGGLDALSFLIRQPSESALVCSFGVFEDGVLYYSDPETSKLHDRYNSKLGKEIYRVTPKGAITFHGLEYSHHLKEAGFVTDTSAPAELNQEAALKYKFFETLRKK